MWRILFEKFLATNYLTTDGHVGVPVVTLLCNGGITALKAFAMKLELDDKGRLKYMENELRSPLIVVKGSGRAADLIAELSER